MAIVSKWLPSDRARRAREESFTTQGILYHLPGDRLKLQGFTLLNLVSYAGDIPDNQIEGLPKWAGTDHFNVELMSKRLPTRRLASH
jgi:uncharacterized protein (TIGR03435 family)